MMQKEAEELRGIVQKTLDAAKSDVHAVGCSANFADLKVVDIAAERSVLYPDDLEHIVVYVEECSSSFASYLHDKHPELNVEWRCEW